jgi:pimeloyl-ACP methyl ester carboxylesterase
MPDFDIPLMDHREEHFFIRSPKNDLRLFLRLLTSKTLPSEGRRAVLYVHGATFPSALSIAHRFDGCSWRDALCEARFDVWALDFSGFGYSDRYLEMDAPAEANPPLCVAEEAAAQLAAAVRFTLKH